MLVWSVLSAYLDFIFFFFFSSRRRHTRCLSDWSSDVCSSDLRVTEVVQPRKAVLEFPAPGFVAKFVWTFEDVSGRTRITQRVSLSGKQVAIYAETVVPSSQAGIPAGMRRLCEAMEAAARGSVK